MPQSQPAQRPQPQLPETLRIRRQSERSRENRRLSPISFLASALGMGAASAILLFGIMFWATRLGMGPERALAISGPFALLVCALISALGAMKARRIGALENGLTGLVFAAISLATLGRYLARTDDHFLAPSMMDIYDLANTFGTTLGGPMGGVGVAAVGIWIAGFIGCSLGFLFGGDGRIDLKFGYESFIAKSHLRLRRRSATMLMTIISVSGVAVGVLALTVVLSVMGGFEIDLKTKIVGANAHVVVMKYSAFTDWKEAAADVRSVKGVLGVSPFTLSEVMLSSDKNLGGALLKGIDPKTTTEVGDVAKNITEGSLDYLAHPEKIPERQRSSFVTIPGEEAAKKAEKGKMDETAAAEAGDESDSDELTIDEILKPMASEKKADVLPGIILGKELAHVLRVSTGDRLNVVSPIGGEAGPAGTLPKSRPFRVAGVFSSGMYEFDAKSAFIAIPEAQRFLGLGRAVTGLEVKTDDVDNTRQTSKAIFRKLGGYPYRTKDFAEMNKNLFSALRLERLVMAVILGFIVLVACFNIVSTLIMMVLEKGQDIAILKSMGAADTSIMKIFVLEGLIIGTVGTAAGIILGLCTCLFVEKFGITLDADVYYIDRLPIEIAPMQFLGVAALALVLSYLATIYPATRASRMHPAEGLRNE